jgi:Tfp pilus assembly protein PilO
MELRNSLNLKPLKGKVAKMIGKIIVAFGWLVAHVHELGNLDEKQSFGVHLKKRYQTCRKGEASLEDSVPSFNVLTLQHTGYLVDLLKVLKWESG